MVSLKNLVAQLCFAAAALASPTSKVNVLNRRTTITTTSSGTVNGYYYYLWNSQSTNSTVSMNIGNGQYSLEWNYTPQLQDVFGGIGWNPGTSQPVTYSGSFNTSGAVAYLSLYGWTTSPSVEYYICDSFSTYNPGSGGLTHMGNVTSDGATYDIYRAIRVSEPASSTIGPQPTIYQYWSVRRDKRVGGTITVANHFEAWKSLGMNMGTLNYQILSTEGFADSGSSSITVHH